MLQDNFKDQFLFLISRLSEDFDLKLRSHPGNRRTITNTVVSAGCSRGRSSSWPTTNMRSTTPSSLVSSTRGLDRWGAEDSPAGPQCRYISLVKLRELLLAYRTCSTNTTKPRMLCCSIGTGHSLKDIIFMMTSLVYRCNSNQEVALALKKNLRLINKDV